MTLSISSPVPARSRWPSTRRTGGREPGSPRRTQIELAGLLVQGSLPGFAVRVADDVLFAVGGVLQRQQRVVGGGQGRDLIQLSLGSCLLAYLGVLADEDHGQGQRGDRVWNTVSCRPGNLTARLSRSHAASAASTISAVTGRDAD
jgi:hypothetical protein